MASLSDLAPLQSEAEDVVALAQADAAMVVRSVDLSSLARQRPIIEQAVGDVIDGYGFGLSALAADWYADARYASPATGRFVPAARTWLTADELSALVGWSIGPLFDADPDMTAALARLNGGVQKQVANQARLTVVDNTRRDPVRPSFYRGASANCCAFCAMLTTRIFTRESSASFDAHDHDRCFPVPVWPGEAFGQPDYYGTFQAEYDEAAAATRAAGESVTAKNVLARMRKATGRK